MLAAIGAVILLGVLGVVGMVLFTTAPVANPLAIGFFLVQSVAAIIMAGMLGAATGLVIAIVDQLVDGRLRDRRMPFWGWLPIGSAMGAMAGVAVAFVLTLDYSPSRQALTSTTDFYAIGGAVCGFIAGPVFGWLFREPERGEREMVQGQNSQLADVSATDE